MSSPRISHQEGFVYRMKLKPDMVPDIEAMPFLTHLGEGYVEVQTLPLLTAYLAREAQWLTLLTEAIRHLDKQADNVRDGLPQGAEILPANLDEADRAGFIDGLRAGARHLSLELGKIARSAPEMPETDDEREAANGNGIEED